jgi:hypothetical protein
VKTHPDTAVFITEDFFSRRTGDDGALRTIDDGFGGGKGRQVRSAGITSKALLSVVPSPGAVLCLWLLPFSTQPVTCHSRFSASEGWPVRVKRFPGHSFGELLMQVAVSASCRWPSA